MNKAPAFQFYPDKWQSHTAHLSDTAYRIYHEMICWMWQHSKDQCSIPAKHETIAMLMRRQCDCIANALQEIMHPEMPLLKTHGDKLVSDGLKKEVAKQTKRREGCSESAKARWHKDLPSCERNANAMPTVCSPSPAPTPTPSPNTKSTSKDDPSCSFDSLIPFVLEEPRFLLAWHSWVQDRKDRKKPITKSAASRQLSKLKDMGVERAIRCIDNSIEHGWLGLFDPDEKQGKAVGNDEEVMARLTAGCV